jgi:hypothetical protein
VCDGVSTIKDTPFFQHTGKYKADNPSAATIEKREKDRAKQAKSRQNKEK